MTADERRTGPPTGHADVDTLADLHAGVLDGPDADRLREHVAGCRQCAATLEAVDAVQGQLRSLPAPSMPAAVAARLDAALADLRTERPASAGGSTAADQEDELAQARLRRSRRLSQAIAAAAAAVVVIAGGGVIASIARGGGTSETASDGAGSAASAPVQPQSNPPAAASADGGSVENDSGGQAALPAYDRASLLAALPTIAGQGVAPRAAALSDPDRQAACARSIQDAAGALRGVQHIQYAGQPAYVFVYTDGARLTGYVVTEACGSAPGRPATVLDTIS
jgi:hypothetical protein